MASRTLKLKREIWEREQVLRATSFSVVMFTGGLKPYDTHRFADLKTAIEYATPLKDRYGRTALVYAITPAPGPMTIALDRPEWVYWLDLLEAAGAGVAPE